MNTCPVEALHYILTHLIDSDTNITIPSIEDMGDNGVPSNLVAEAVSEIDCLHEDRDWCASYR